MDRRAGQFDEAFARLHPLFEGHGDAQVDALAATLDDALDGAALDAFGDLGVVVEAPEFTLEVCPSEDVLA